MSRILLAGSDRLTKENIAISHLQIDGQVVYVKKSFADRKALIGYLNGIMPGFEYLPYNNTIAYNNKEQYTSIMIAPIYQTSTFILKVGAPSAKPFRSPFPVYTLDNGTAITTDLLKDKEIKSIAINGTWLIPGDWGRVGNTIQVTVPYADSFITVVVQQVAPGAGKTAKPVLTHSRTGNVIRFGFAGVGLFVLKKGSTPDEADATALFLPTSQTYYNYMVTGSGVEYFFLYAIDGDKEVSNADGYELPDSGLQLPEQV